MYPNNDRSTSRGVLLFWIVAMFACAVWPQSKAETGEKTPLSADEVLAVPEEWYCPWCGEDPEFGPWRHRTGPGVGDYDFRPGYGGGPSMTFRGPQMGEQYWEERLYDPAEDLPPLKEKEARTILERYVLPSDRFSVGEIHDRKRFFSAELLGPERNLVQKVLVDKSTGWVRAANETEPP